MKYFNKLVLSSVLVMTSICGTMLADSFSFSYVFSDGLGAPGSFSGTLTGTQVGDMVTVLSVDSLVVNGIAASGTIYSASYDSGVGDFAGSGSGVVSFTLGSNNFIFINSDYGSGDTSGDTYAWIALDYFPEAYAGRPDDGSGFDTSVSYDEGDGVWTLTNLSTVPGVPDGGATIGLLGLALVGFAAVRRKLG